MAEAVEAAESFRRARTPEQRHMRRERILEVTRELLGQRRVAELSLNEIARRVGLAKSNVLRYFGSREAILLVVFEREYAAWVEALEELAAESGGREGPGEQHADDVARLAEDLARSAVRHPLLCELLSCTATVLEHNVDVEEVIEFKLALNNHIDRLVALMAPRLGGLPAEEATALVISIHAIITHVWALGCPAPALAEAARRDERIFSPPDDVVPLLTRALELLLRGVARQ